MIIFGLHLDLEDYLHEPPEPPPAASPFDMPLVNCNGNVSNKILQPHHLLLI